MIKNSVYNNFFILINTLTLCIKIIYQHVSRDRPSIEKYKYKENKEKKSLKKFSITIVGVLGSRTSFSFQI